MTLTVTRTGGNTSGSATVEYDTVSGTATGGVHYVSDSDTVTFGPGDLSEEIVITLNNNSDISGKRIFTVVLSNPNAAALGASVATVEIMDDDTVESDFSWPIDGKNDIVHRNETTGDGIVHLMNGTTFNSSFNLLQNGGSWRLRGVADFNGDGSADLLYRNVSTLQLIVWYMQGSNIIGTGNIASPPNSS